MDVFDVRFQIILSGKYSVTNVALRASRVHVTVLYKTDRVRECFETCSTPISSSFFTIY